VTSDYCKANAQLNVTSLLSGYIASVMTSDTPHCDGSSQPWLIAGRPGQTVNLTLYDFAIETSISARQRTVSAVTNDPPTVTRYLRRCLVSD